MSRPTLRRLVSATAITALVFSLMPVSSAFAARNIEAFACPEADVPDQGFTDVEDGNVHADAIDCIVWYGIAGGRTSSTYAPSADVSRGAMATFLANLVVEGGVTLPAAPENAFDDDDGTTHEANINALAELGVVEGTGERTYAPNQPVRRGQMATFLNNAYEAVTGAALTSEENAFSDDDGTTHEANINAVAAAGIADGRTATEYAPTLPVRRDQMASFVARTVDLLVEEGFIEVPRQEGDNATALDVPELLRAEIASATSVRFVFDEALNSAMTTAAFGLYSYDATRTEATTTTRESTDTVLATFTDEAVANATLAAVAAGAVQDVDAQESSEGHAALDDVTLAAGTTAAPDLVEVSVRANEADFTFDEVAHNLTPEGYHLVLTDGTVRDSTAVAEGEGTTTHTVTFELTAEEAATVAYGYVDDATVSDQEGDGNPLNGDEGNLNVLQAADVSADGLTERPDLVEVVLDPATETVDYVFDEAVTRATGDPIQGDPGDFRVYFTDASDAVAASSERTDTNVITATFAAGTLDEFVAGAIVDDGSAVDTDGDGANRPQELGFELFFAAGDTAAPELLLATIADEAADDDTTNRVVRYVFDDDITTLVDGTAFKVYARDGSSHAFAGDSPFPPSAGNCAIDTGNAKVVECAVNESDAEAFAFLGTAVVAAVERDAVESDGGFGNAEGAAILQQATA